ncbi:aspartyl protease family protein [Kordiimonas marina]|uniref:aspartyl protease family protein n=1 Tax=Kordiimonas marina TaxID=2872312 RepID=UPI001FF2660D|nr:aspartyl protease family protein [Kordiimonas marina]MCJ9429674.1 aspartyl protease family protein [Kordiimonas marina]
MRLPFLFLCLLVLAPFAGFRAGAEDFALSRGPEGRFLVDARVGAKVGAKVGSGKTYPFVLDTGSGRSMVYRSLVTELGLKALPFKSVRVHTATGLRSMPLYDVGVLQALGRTLPADGIAMMPDVGKPGAYGILGVDLMGGMMLEIGGDRVRVIKDDDPLPAGDWYQIGGRPVGNGSLAVDVNVAGLAIPALVDTGANFTVVNQAAAIKLMQMADITITDKNTGIRAAGGGMRAGTFTADSLTIGGKTYKDVRILVASLPVFATLGAARSPAMILGVDVIGRQPVVLDFGAWTLAIRKTAD